MLRFVLLASACLLSRAADLPDYFPLDVGDQWIYRATTGTAFYTVSVNRAVTLQDQTYFGVTTGDGPEALLRNDGAGHVYRFEASTGSETLLYDFTQGVSSGIQLGVPYTITRNGPYTGPIGTFSSLLLLGRIDTLQESQQGFLPYIGRVYGLTRFTSGSASLVPAQVENLVYARLGGITVVTSRDWSFSLSSDRPVYNLGFGNTEDCQTTNFPGQTATAAAYRPCLLARVAFHLSGSDPVPLLFPTGQIFELELRNASGEVVYRLSDHRVYDPKPTEIDLGPGERNFTEVIPLYTEAASAAVRWLPAGKYRLFARLADTPEGTAFAGIAFEIHFDAQPMLN